MYGNKTWELDSRRITAIVNSFISRHEILQDNPLSFKDFAVMKLDDGNYYICTYENISCSKERCTLKKVNESDVVVSIPVGYSYIHGTHYKEVKLNKEVTK